MPSIARRPAGFTLIEVMIAVGVAATALLALLALQHQNLQAVIAAQDLTRASMLAQELMTQAELERFPDTRTTTGDFHATHRNQFPNFRWQRVVEPSAVFPDIRKVTIRILYGPGGRRTFEVVEFLHNPLPQYQ